MKLFFSLFFSISLFFTGFSAVLVASRPATKTTYHSKKAKASSVEEEDKTKNEIKKKTIHLRDSIQTKVEPLPEKPKKNGLGMMIWGSLLTLLGIIFGVGLLLIFLLGFSIGSGFYFRDIYAIAGVMLGGLITFGVGIYMISRGRERWRTYKRYRKALKKMRKMKKAQ
ncbi:hypothetical protein ACE193_08690 [Bernardetia sp. OM2101]|uniref:hypothetical protein n=1 Tax=Bernardetia sp. OM2101 TaxID=3344876 RepID=UPI0035CF91E3